MASYTATFTTTLTVNVTVQAADEDSAADDAWERANEFLKTLGVERHGISAAGDLDGVGADEVVEN